MLCNAFPNISELSCFVGILGFALFVFTWFFKLFLSKWVARNYSMVFLFSMTSLAFAILQTNDLQMVTRFIVHLPHFAIHFAIAFRKISAILHRPMRRGLRFYARVLCGDSNIAPYIFVRRSNRVQ